MSEQEIIDNLLHKVRENIIANQGRLNLTASGRSASELTVNTKKQGATINGKLIDKAGYFEFQERGRKPGKMPPVQGIYDWLQYAGKYGINYRDERERRSIAFAIATKIAKEGTYTFQRNTTTGVISESGIEEEIEKARKGFVVLGKFQLIQMMKA